MAEGIAGPGFYPQPNEWTCGPFALKHALLALGRMVEQHPADSVQVGRRWQWPHNHPVNPDLVNDNPV